MTVKHLGNTDFSVIMECFLLAFENYFVKMPTDYNYYKQRWKAAKVNFNLSYGMFDDDKLVGFIINAIDERQGDKIAYNTGTGVIPDYRGRKIVKSIYDYAIPELLKNGITKCLLEVITENYKAIKSYKGIGFKICKEFKCFKGRLFIKSQNDFTLKKVTYQDMNWSEFPNQNLYSWDNQKESLLKGQYDYFQVLNSNHIQSYFVMNSENGYVAQFEVLENSTKNLSALFSAIQSINQEIRINNIDNKLNQKIKAVESVGLKNTVNQFEMELLF